MKRLVHWKELELKMAKKLNVWKGKTLSIEGRYSIAQCMLYCFLHFSCTGNNFGKYEKVEGEILFGAPLDLPGRLCGQFHCVMKRKMGSVGNGEVMVCLLLGPLTCFWIGIGQTIVRSI